MALNLISQLMVHFVYSNVYLQLIIHLWLLVWLVLENYKFCFWNLFQKIRPDSSLIFTNQNHTWQVCSIVVENSMPLLLKFMFQVDNESVSYAGQSFSFPFCDVAKVAIISKVI
jgi:hypothetical protein